LNSGSVPENGLNLPFKPYVWLGNENCGFGICCESNQYFQNSDPSKVFSIEVKDDYVNIHISILHQTPTIWTGMKDEW